VPEWRGRAGAKRRTVAKERGCADRRAARGTECTECCIVCMTTECLFCTPCGIQPEWQARMARLRRSKAEELQERRRQEHSGGCGSGRAVKAGVRTRRRSCSALSSLQLYLRGAPQRSLCDLPPPELNQFKSDDAHLSERYLGTSGGDAKGSRARHHGLHTRFERVLSASRRSSLRLAGLEARGQQGGPNHSVEGTILWRVCSRTNILGMRALCSA
jgi:hypothetical protein